MTPSEKMLSRRDGQVGYLIFNNPERHNAVSLEMWAATSEILEGFAKEIFFTARQFDAEEARMMGFVNRIMPEAELENYVKTYAETIAANAPLTLKASKYIANEVMKDESKRNLARCMELVEQCFTSKDYTEGRQAFMEKRKPAFTGS